MNRLRCFDPSSASGAVGVRSRGKARTVWKNSPAKMTATAGQTSHSARTVAIINTGPAVAGSPSDPIATGSVRANPIRPAFTGLTPKPMQPSTTIRGRRSKTMATGSSPRGQATQVGFFKVGQASPPVSSQTPRAGLRSSRRGLWRPGCGNPGVSTRVCQPGCGAPGCGAPGVATGALPEVSPGGPGPRSLAGSGGDAALEHDGFALSSVLHVGEGTPRGDAEGDLGSGARWLFRAERRKRALLMGRRGLRIAGGDAGSDAAGVVT